MQGQGRKTPASPYANGVSSWPCAHCTGPMKSAHGPVHSAYAGGVSSHPYVLCTVESPVFSTQCGAISRWRAGGVVFSFRQLKGVSYLLTCEGWRGFQENLKDTYIGGARGSSITHPLGCLGAGRPLHPQSPVKPVPLHCSRAGPFSLCGGRWGGGGIPAAMLRSRWGVSSRGHTTASA